MKSNSTSGPEGKVFLWETPVSRPGEEEEDLASHTDLVPTRVSSHGPTRDGTAGQGTGKEVGKGKGWGPSLLRGLGRQV